MTLQRDVVSPNCDLSSRAARLNRGLSRTPPTVGHTGAVRMSRSVCGHTFGGTHRAVRELIAEPGRNCVSAQSWTRPASVSASGNVVLRGRGLGMALQDLYSHEDCDRSIAGFIDKRERCSSVMGNRPARHGQFSNYERSSSSCDSRTTPRSVPGIHTVTMHPAGSPSTSWKLDSMRLLNARTERATAIRNKEWPSAIAR
mmetsp:Transcript_53124/g.102670  ORF Transcript_53124/g.102670 Transcript_53124/m.102670 type:complete len:200 (-) Transcript_53124:225-824(-)